MNKRKGPTIITYVAIGLGIFVVFACTFILKDKALEHWYLWQMKNGDKEEQWAAAICFTKSLLRANARFIHPYRPLVTVGLAKRWSILLSCAQTPTKYWPA